jgi:glutamate-1-semialdehyde 2,1-aminomutase
MSRGASSGWTSSPLVTARPAHVVGQAGRCADGLRGCGNWSCWAGLCHVRNQAPGHAANRGAEHDTDGAVARWARENPRSQALNARARRLLPGGVTHDVRLTEPFPVAVARAEGARKWDLDGHELICYAMGHGALLLGHCHPEVVSAVRAQAGKVFLPGASHELESDWTELVIRLVPSAELVRFTASGTEATLLALRVARAATGRDRIIKLAGHFHGWHDQVALGADPPFDGPDTAGLPRAITDTVTVIPASAQALAAALDAGDVAAVIMEPSGAAWGTVPLPDGFLAAARDLTEAAGTLLVFDEVVTGFRWAPGGVQQVAGVRPDLTALGKILAGGMPAGAVCGRADLIAHIGGPGYGPGRVAHPGTHNAHPVSAAAGITTLGLAASGELQTGAGRTAASLQEGLNAAFTEAGVAGCAYGDSSTFHLLFGHATPDGLEAGTLKDGVPGGLSPALHCAMLSRGVHLFHGSGFLSAAHGDREVEQTVSAFAATLKELQQEGLL